MEIVYIPGGELDFVTYIKTHRSNADLREVDGYYRWIIKREDGTEYIARPSETEHAD